MATTAYLAGTDSNDLEMSYAAETTWATSPSGSGDYQKFRLNSESFAEEKSRTRPPEIRADGQSAAAVTQDIRARGGLQFGISYGNVDDLWAGLLMGEWTTDLAISESNISAVNATSKFVGTAGDFDDVVVGQWIKVAGFSTAGANGYYRVKAKAVDGSDITVSPAPADDPGSTAETITITGSMLRNATTVTSFTIQKRLGSGLGFVYPGTFFIGGQINAQRGQFFSGTLDAICKSEVKQASELGTNAQAAPTNRVMNVVGNFAGLRKDDTAFAGNIMGLNITLARQGADMAFALGSAAAAGIGSKGTLDVTGTMEVYFEDYSLYDDYVAETGLHISYRVTDTAGNTYVVTIPELVLSRSTVVVGGPNQPVMARFDWMADPHPTLNHMIQIDRMAA
jgi:hypothetical protein